MRKLINFESQTKFGQVDIAEIELDPRCRDDITKMLQGVQHIYTTPEIREQVFQILEEEVPVADTENGRPGMDLWRILVLSLLRVCCNCDWDRVHNQANNHFRLRQMMGIDEWDVRTEFPLQTIKDNVSLLKSETINKINTVVVEAGHKLVKKKLKSLD